MAREQRLYSKFYWQDWLTDPSLRLVSYAAKGLWMDILSLMWCGEKQGFLLINGSIPTSLQLARLTGGRASEVESLMRELEEAGVSSKDSSGVVYSRRMVRDIDYVKKQSAHGKNGGNPKLLVGDALTDALRQADNGGVKATLKGGDKGGLKVLDTDTDTDTNTAKGLRLDSDADKTTIAEIEALGKHTEFDQFWAAYPNQRGMIPAQRAWIETAAMRPPTAEMLELLARHKASEAWRADDGKWIPLAAKWLSDGRWLDQLESVGIPSNSRKKKKEAPADWRATYSEVMGYDCPEWSEWERLPDDLQAQILDATPTQQTNPVTE